MNPKAPRLTLDEALAMLDSMAAQADRDSDEADADDAIMSHFWYGWAEGLRTLRQHIETGVKATCFPMGSCTCHPVNVPTTEDEHRSAEFERYAYGKPGIRL